MRSRVTTLLGLSLAAFGLGSAPDALAAPSADVAISQSASPEYNGAGFLGAGGWTTYSITVRNLSPSTPATDVAVTDPLPSAVQYVSSTYGCSFAGGQVSCRLGTVAPGGAVRLEVVGHLVDYSLHGTFSNTVSVTSSTPDPDTSNNSSISYTNVYNSSQDPALNTDHLVQIEHVEQAVAFDPGQTQNVSLHCPDGSQVIDGNFKVDAVDQGTGTLRSVQVDSSQALADGDFQIAATNTATGRAQGHAFGVCMPRSTDPGPDGHSHSITVEPPQRVTIIAPAPGHYDVAVPCDTSRTAEQIGADPGFSLGGGAQGEVVRSETNLADAPGWNFGFEISTPGTITASVRCLDHEVGVTNAHYHELWISHPDTFVSVPASSTVDDALSCSDQAKGIVATYNLPAGVHLAGDDPEVKSRGFRLINETSADQSVHLDLVCVGDRTGIDPVSPLDALPAPSPALPAPAVAGAPPAGILGATTPHRAAPTARLRLACPNLPMPSRHPRSTHAGKRQPGVRSRCAQAVGLAHRPGSRLRQRPRARRSR